MLHLILKSMLFYVEVFMPPKPTIMALVAKGDPPIHETFLPSIKTTEASVVVDRFHATTLFSTDFACHTDATAETYIQNSMLDNNSCIKHHGAKQLVNLAAICCEIEYHMVHWDSLFLALATALNDHQEMQPIVSNMQPNSTAATHNAPQLMTVMITIMKAEQ